METRRAPPETNSDPNAIQSLLEIDRNRPEKLRL